MATWPIEEIQQLLEPTLAHMGYSIYALGQAGGGGRTLRITIDKPEGFISLDDCERVSVVAGPLLDQADLIPGPYTLEVSSPGAERKLRDRTEYERFVGRGPVQGFAVTLMIGVAVSLISSIVVTHNLLAIVLNFGWARTSGTLGVARGRA